MPTTKIKDVLLGTKLHAFKQELLLNGNLVGENAIKCVIDSKFNIVYSCGEFPKVQNTDVVGSCIFDVSTLTKANFPSTNKLVSVNNTLKNAEKLPVSWFIKEDEGYYYCIGKRKK